MCTWEIISMKNALYQDTSWLISALLMSGCWFFKIIFKINLGLNFFCCGIIMIMVKLSISPNCQIEKKVWDDPGFAFGI